MSFKQKCKQNFIVGKNVTIMLDGLEYSGEVLDFDFLMPTDSNVTLVNKEDGKIYYLPVSQRMVIVVNYYELNSSDELENEDENEDENEIENEEDGEKNKKMISNKNNNTRKFKNKQIRKQTRKK